MPLLRLYGIIGRPVAHSMSPALHNWGFSLHGYPGVYTAWEKGPEDLPAFINAMRSLPIHGASVTLPNKEAVIPLLDGITPNAHAVGAVNTLFWENGKLMGDNTDVAGFLAPLKNKHFEKVLVLGAGGACRAVLAGLYEHSAPSVTIAVRSPEKTVALQQDFGCQVIPWSERIPALAMMGQGLVINATPLGMHGKYEDTSPLPADAWPAASPQGAYLAYDLIYTPQETVFLGDARARGWQTQSGLDFFVEQGCLQFQRWTGLSLPKKEAEARILGALQANTER